MAKLAKSSPVQQLLEKAEAFAGEVPAKRLQYARAVEAVVWGMPIVSVDAMRHAFLRDAKARYGDILYCSKPADWRFQITTPNASSLYIYFNFNLKDGPLVLEFPAAIGAGLFGSLEDAWQVPLADVGPEGEDKGKGGRYLLLPPGYKQVIPPGYIAVPSSTLNGYGAFRAIPVTRSEDDMAKAIALVKKLHLYPLSQTANPPKQRFIDIAGQPFNAIATLDDTFFDALSHMIGEEPVHERDMVAMAQLRTLGIEKNKEFKPDKRMRELLKRAATEAHQRFKQQLTMGEPYWPEKQWLLNAKIGPKTGFTYQTTDHLEIDERGMVFFLACAAPKKLGAASVYVAAYADAAGNAFDGGKEYRLRVPAHVPAKQYWAVTVYDMETAAFIRDAPSLAIDSYGEDVEKNADGSVDVYFGPSPPKGKDANWIATMPGQRWFTFFRFYGPDKAVFDKSWVLPDIELA